MAVHLRPLTPAERDEFIGPCSLCGSRRKDEPRAWRLAVATSHPEVAPVEPSEYLACSRCRRALRELAEIVFGGSLNFDGHYTFSDEEPY